MESEEQKKIRLLEEALATEKQRVVDLNAANLRNVKEAELQKGIAKGLELAFEILADKIKDAL